MKVLDFAPLHSDSKDMFQKKLIIFFFIISVILTLDFMYSPVFVQAQDQGGLLDLNKCTNIKIDPPKICLQVSIGAKEQVSGIAEYISTFYNFFVGAVATLAIFMIVIGGVRWLFARGNPGKIGAAKKTIESAFLGMLLVFVSVALLRIINPDLISLKVPGLVSVKQNVLDLPWSGVQVDLFCQDIKDMNNNYLIQELESEDGQKIAFPPQDFSVLSCNKKFKLSKYTGAPLSLVCFGHYCNSGTCLSTGSGGFQCLNDLYVYGIFTSDTSWPEVSITFHPVCGQSNTVVAPYDSSNFSYSMRGSELYHSRIGIDTLKTKCGSDELRGVVIGVRVTNVVDSSSLLGSDCKVLRDGTGKRIQPPGTPVNLQQNQFFSFDQNKKAVIECNPYITSVDISLD